jgi:negative regulator of sigma E activity
MRWLPAARLSSAGMLDRDAAERLSETGDRASAAEARGDSAVAGEEWRRYRLIRDAARDPDELLAEGIALSVQAAELAAGR